MYENLIYESADGIALITINRTASHNALDRLTMSELLSAFESTVADDSVRVVILTGSGDKAFAAGADIDELRAQSAEEGREYSSAGQGVLHFLEQLGKPVIAAVNGYALGGGCELAMACTLRVASENAKFGQPEVRLGLIPGYGGSQRLARLVGHGRALEMLLTGEPIDANAAFRIGLVNRVVPLTDLRAAAFEIAEKIHANAPVAVRYCLEAVQQGLAMNSAESQSLESTLFGLCFATEDAKEGTAAFLEKRAPKFRGK